MKLKSFLSKLFWGEELSEKTNSPINGEIRVYDSWFGRRMQIGGVTQSGELVEKLWKTGIKAISYKPLAISNFLILGLGCGNVAKLISQKWPGAKITGIEIDSEVVRIGKKYFKLDEISNLKIIITDALKAISNKQLAISNKYNLILVDLYLGNDFPKEAESEEFLQGLKNLLSKNGLVIINRLYYTSFFKKEAEVFLEKVKGTFPNVTTKKTITNLLIFASLKAEKRV